MNEPWGTIGDRSSRPQTDELRRVISASVTGRNLLSGAQDVEYVFTSDPTGTVGSWPEGARGIYPIDATHIGMVRYLRSTGWRGVTLT